jgi:hypothetical protein
MYDQLCSDGFSYSSDGNGYSSNVINWNAAVAFEANNEFTPGNRVQHYHDRLFRNVQWFVCCIEKLAEEKGVNFKYVPDTRLRSIVKKGDVIHYTYATRKEPWVEAGSSTTNAAWLAMPRYSIELVAQANRFEAAGAGWMC